MQRFQGGLVFKTHKLLYHSTLGLREIKEREGSGTRVKHQGRQEGFRVSGFGITGPGFRVSGFEFRVSGFGFQVSGFGVRVPGFGFQVWVRERSGVPCCGALTRPGSGIPTPTVRGDFVLMKFTGDYNKGL